MRILFVGGGTLGPVTPLLALVERLRTELPSPLMGEGRVRVTVLGLVGTTYGPERELAHAAGLKFYRLTAPKLRRYFDLRTLAAPFLFMVGLIEALMLLRRLKPTIIVSGGSFVGVPLVIAAWLLRIPSLIHQQDVRPSLANQLAAPFATKITLTFESTRLNLVARKTVVTGNPVRQTILSGDAGRAGERFGLEQGVPTVLIFGGGTGAQFINELVWSALPELTQLCQVVHVTGSGKSPIPSVLFSSADHTLSADKNSTASRYHVYELLTKEMADAYSAADLIVARAGVGTITELAALGKSAIIIPIPGTHQEENAALLARHEAAVIAAQSDLTPEKFTGLIKELLSDHVRREKLSQNIRGIMPSDAAYRLLDIIKSSSP